MHAILKGSGHLYLQLSEVLRETIRSGVAETLPSERDLAASFGVARVTVRKALDELDADGLIIRCRGTGTRVRR